MSKPKMLYICNHDILEYNHLKLFHSIGFDVISTCKYLEPDLISDFALPKLNVPYNKELVAELKALNPIPYRHGRGRLNLSKDFLDKFDVIVSSWIIEPLIEYLPYLSNKVVCCETLGQSNGARERTLSQLKARGVNLIRISEGESYFPNFAGADAIIDLEVDTDYFNGWEGTEPFIMTVNTAFNKRVNDCKYNEYRRVIEGLPAKLFGRENEGIKESFSKGEVTREELLRQYQINRVGFASVSVPCPCTLTPKEMMATGMPVVTYGPKIGGPTFRAHKYVEQGGAGFWSDNISDIQDSLRNILQDDALAKELSVNARQTALKLFSHEVIADKWKNFFIGKGITL